MLCACIWVEWGCLKSYLKFALDTRKSEMSNAAGRTAVSTAGCSPRVRFLGCAHNVQFENPTHTVATKAWNRCLLKYSVCFPIHFSDVVKINLKHHSVVSPCGFKTVFIFNQIFCCACDDEIVCVLYSNCQATNTTETLDQQTCDWKWDSFASWLGLIHFPFHKN